MEQHVVGKRYTVLLHRGKTAIEFAGKLVGEHGSMIYLANGTTTVNGRISRFRWLPINIGSPDSCRITLI